MRRAPDRAVSGRSVLAGTAVAAVLLTSLITMTEWLRHPAPGTPAVVELDEQDRDPRLPVDCPLEEPREDLQREVPVVGPASPPIPVSADELLDCPGSFDRLTVRYRGEVVGGVMRRAGGAWTQVNDDAYARTAGALHAHRDYRGANVGIGVLLPADLADEIGMVGGPRTRGDFVEVVGVFRRVDHATREVAVIRASSGEVLRPGARVPDPPLRRRQLAATLLALVAATVVAAERAEARRGQRSK